MEITEVRIKLMEDPSERLQAFCSITFDHAFVIRDLKIIGGTNGAFVAMPSRRLTSHCPQCGGKNHLKAGYCNQCGMRLKHDTSREDEGRAKLYADIAHPINQACRDMIQQKVIEAFHLEQERAKQPGYVSSYDDFDEDVAPPPRRAGGQMPRRDAPHRELGHREPARHDQGRPEPAKQDSQPVVRRTPPVAPAPATSGTPTPTPAPHIAPTVETKKVEPAATEPPAPHTNLSPAQNPESAQPKKPSFGEGIL
jgi:stage V sporulation protein G